MTGTAEPPYLRIVAEIRRRVAEGELAPGDRVPSTRQIAAEWNVALATATKALTALRQEGVVRAQPRVGTVVAAPDPAPAPARRRPTARTPATPDSELTRERVVRAAIEIADAEGLDALSMRGVAARLGVATMSPYRHVNSKDDLILLMADAAYGELSPAEQPPTHWRARVESGARALWRLYRRHPWLAQLGPLTRPLPLPNLMAHGDRMLDALGSLGLDPTATFDLHVLVYSYGQGLAVNLEREAHAEASTGLSDEQWVDTQASALRALADSGRYPAFTRAIDGFQDGYHLDLDRIFELGLRSLLDGFARLAAGRR